MATTYWADGLNGDDGNDGLSSSMPIKTLATLAFLGGDGGAGCGDGDVIRLKNTFREPLKIGGGNPPGVGCTITDWGDGTGYVVRGDTVLDKSTATYGGAAGVFNFAIANGTVHFGPHSAPAGWRDRTLKEGIATVVVDWDTNIDASLRHFGHLVRATGPTDVITRADSWWFDDTAGSVSAGAYVAGAKVAGTNQDGSGTLIINLSEGYTSTAALVAGAKVIAYVLANVNGIEIGTQRYKDNNFTQGDPVADNPNGTRSWTIENGSVYLFADSGWRSEYNVGDTGVDIGATKLYNTNSMGYGIRPSDWTNGTVRNMTVIDAGYHGIMFVGSRCNGNTMSNCTIWGGAPNPISGNSIGGAFYCSDSGSWDHNIFGCRAHSVTLNKYVHLDRNGVPLQFPFDNAVNTTGALHAGYTTCNTDGFITHTNTTAGNDVTDVQFNDCIVNESGKLSDNTLSVGNGMVAGNTGLSVAATDVYDWTKYPVRYNHCTLHNAAQNRTSGSAWIAYRRCAFYFDRGDQVVTAGGSVGSSGSTNNILFDACIFVFNLTSPGATARYGFQCPTSDGKIRFLNCSTIILGTDTNAKHIFNFLDGGGDSVSAANPCVITHTAHGLVNGNTINVTRSSTTAAITPGAYTVTKITNDTFSIPFDTTSGAGLVEWNSTFGVLTSVHKSYVFARGCIWGFASTVGGSTKQLLTMGTTPNVVNLNETNFDFQDNRYYRIVVPCGFPGPNDMTKWTSTWNNEGVDQGAVNDGTTNPFVSETATTDLALTTAAKLTKKRLTTHANIGYNGSPYDGTYGAWQYGGGGFATAVGSGGVLDDDEYRIG